MSVSNTFSRFLIVNGQPILIKDDIGLNPTQNLTPDILQQAIDDVTAAEPISPIGSCGRIEEGGGIKNSNINTHCDSTGGNEYVAVLASDQSCEDVSASTIQLTLEQAAQLGIHFTVDNAEQNLHSGTNATKSDKGKSFSNGQFLTSSSNSDILKRSADCVQIDNEMTCNLSQDDDLDKGNDSTTFIDSFGPVNTSENHPLTIVPQIVNGTVTYTLQLCTQSESHTSTSDFFTIDDSSIITQVNEPQKGLKLDAENALSSLSFINSNGVRGKKLHDPTSANLTNQDRTSSPAFELVSSDNLTFVSLSDTISGSHNISNIVTNVNNITKQANNNIKPIQNPIRNKIMAGESLLLKQRTSLAKNVLNTNNNLNISTQKVSEKSNLVKQTSSSTASKFVNECSKQDLKLSAETILHADKVTSSGNRDKRSELNLLTENNAVSSLNTSLKEGNQNRHEDLILIRPSSTPTIITPHVGDFPEEISTAMNRFPIKTDANKPLGSNENPIKLVQQGSTFHSMQELTEDHISKLKPILQENFEAKTSSKNVVYDPTSNTRIIYRIISPEEVSLRKQDEFPRRRGRPKKMRFPNSQVDYVEDGAPVPKKFYPRTRSGRLSRPPKHMVRDYKHIRQVELDDSDGAYSDYQSDHEVDVSSSITTEPVELLPGLVTNRKNNKRNISAGNYCPTCGKVYLGYVRMKRHFDKYPEHGSIEYLDTIRNSNLESEVENLRITGGNGLWKKGKRKGKGRGLFFTGDKRTRLKEALDSCSGADIAEVAGPTVAGVLSLWELLLLRVDAVKQDSRVSALYSEVRQLLCKLRQMASRLFHPLDHALPPDSKDVTIQVDDELMTNVLNIPSGMYLACEEDLNLDEVSSPPEPMYTQESQVTQSNPMAENKGQEKNIQVLKSKMDLDEVSEPFLLTSEEMICDSDERGLVNVDEIVSERLQNFTGRLQPSTVDELMKGLNDLDHRDNKIEADDLMEGFSIATRRTHVSASTEDLMKSLEHFESDLNHSDPPVSLDRDTFDRVTNVDTIDFEVLSREFHSNNR